MKHDYKLRYLSAGSAKHTGKPAMTARFVIEKQLLDTNAWNHFVYAYKNNADIDDHGWRGEYWGKMMRGACLTYMYTGDEELYKVLTGAAADMLRAQTSRGTFTTYNYIEREFSGWDMWCRKYILTGFQHYYDICRDPVMKQAIVKALCEHADYICEKIGAGEGQKSITQTSDFWLGVNSCSILEPMLRLYEMTGRERYKEFAEYIISTGGIQHELNLVELALENKLKPYEYPENKAYETMSFFEGVLAYYELFGKEEYFTAVKNFVEAVYETDITVIGCAGCTHELFDHSAEKQAQDAETVMQETCVTVTWMRLLARLHLLTGEAKYAERIERSALNALYGSVNTNMLGHTISWKGTGNKGGPYAFDSYSPLYNGKRGVGIGGYRVYKDGFAYGCCACIGSAGTALYPLLAVLESKDGAVLNYLSQGEVTVGTPSGARAVLKTVRGFTPDSFADTVDTSIEISLEKSERFDISIRVPENCRSFTVEYGGRLYGAKDGYVTLSCEFSDGDVINVRTAYALSEIKIGGRTAFMFGPYVLARDSMKEGGKTDITEKFALARKNGSVQAKVTFENGGDSVKAVLTRADGGELCLTEYASCGKEWDNEEAFVTVFMNAE